MSNPAGEERENIPLLRAGWGLEGPRCGGSDSGLLPGQILPGAEESSGQGQGGVLFPGIHLGGLAGAAGS